MKRTALTTAALAFAAGTAYYGLSDSGYMYSDVCTAIDGDTLHCGRGEKVYRLRLNGVDAPEKNTLPGVAAHAYMARLIANRRVYWTRYKSDRYGRDIVQARVGKSDLSCALLSSLSAAYVPRWDEQGATLKLCPTITMYYSTASEHANRI